MNEHEQYLYWPPLRNFWDPDSDESMAAAAGEMLADHAKFDEPDHLTKMRRGPERLEIRAYAHAKMIVITMPRCAGGLLFDGVEIEMPATVHYSPLHWSNLTSAEAFYACFCRHQDGYQDQGWEVAL